MVLLEQVVMLSLNLMFGIAMLFIIRRVLKTWIKKDVTEAIEEIDRKRIKMESISRVQHTRNKYSIMERKKETNDNKSLDDLSKRI